MATINTNTWVTPWGARSGAYTQEDTDPRFPWRDSSGEDIPSATGALTQVLVNDYLSGGDGYVDRSPSVGPAPSWAGSAVGALTSLIGAMNGVPSPISSGVGRGLSATMKGENVPNAVIDGIFGGLLSSLGPMGLAANLGLNALGFSLGRGVSEAVSPTETVPGFEGGFFSNPGIGSGISGDFSESNTPSGYDSGDLGTGITGGFGLGSTAGIGSGPTLGGLQGAMEGTFSGDYGGSLGSGYGSDGDGSGGGYGGGSGSGPGANGGEDGGSSDGNNWRRGGLIRHAH